MRRKGSSSLELRDLSCADPARDAGGERRLSEGRVPVGRPPRDGADDRSPKIPAPPWLPPLQANRDGTVKEDGWWALWRAAVTRRHHNLAQQVGPTRAALQSISPSPGPTALALAHGEPRHAAVRIRHHPSAGRQRPRAD